MVLQGCRCATPVLYVVELLQAEGHDLNPNNLRISECTSPQNKVLAYLGLN